MPIQSRSLSPDRSVKGWPDSWTRVPGACPQTTMRAVLESTATGRGSWPSALPRGLKANTHAHFRRFTAASAKLTLRVLHGQIAQADHRLTVCGERLGLSTRSLLLQRRDRFAGLEVRLRASKLSNAQAQRNAIARQRERTHRLSERAGRALATLLQPRGPVPRESGSKPRAAACAGSTAPRLLAGRLG